MYTCKKCGIEKPASDFYAHPASSTGHDSSCKVCRKEMLNISRAKNIDYYREYDKRRYKEDPKRKERNIKYSKSEAGKIAAKRNKAKWLKRNPIKRAAHIILGNAVSKGSIKKLYSCESCGVTGVRIHGHHDDYAKPLEVKWLCSFCHSKWHQENGEAKNG